MKKSNNLMMAALIYVIGSFFTQGLRFITLPVFARIMSTEDFGYLSSYETWVAIITVLVGLQTAGSISNAYIDYKREKLEEYIYSITYIGTFSAVVISIILTIFSSFFSKLFEVSKYSLFLGIVQCLFTFFLNVLINEYRMLDKPWQYLVFTVGNSIINITLAIFFVIYMPSAKYIGRVYALTISAFIFGILALVLIIRNTNNKKIESGYIRYALKLSLPLVFHAFAAIILSRCDQLMLLKYAGPSEAGIYSYGTNFAHIIYVLYTACNQAYIPWYYKKLEKNCEKEIVQANRNYITFFSLGFLAFIFILPEIIKLMSTSDYYKAIYFAPIVALGFYMNFLYNFPVNYEFFHKKTHFIALGTVGAAIMNAILNMLLIPPFGGIGAAVATASSYMILLIVHIYIAKRIIGNYSMPIYDFAIAIILVLLIFTLYYICVDKIIIRFILFAILVILALRSLSIMKKSLNE